MEKTSFRQKIALVIFGIVLLGILLEIGLRIGGLVFLAFQERRNIAAMRKAGAYKIMCIGESTTALGGEDSYPSQLEELLNAQDTGMTFSVINKGISGIITPRISSKLPGFLKIYHPDMVVSMMGINDYDAVRIDINTLTEGNISLQGEPSFFQSLRVYKLFSLLDKHIRSKIKELSSGRLEDNLDVPADIEQQESDIGAKILEDNCTDSEKCYEAGSFFRGRGDYDKATAMFERYLKFSPGDYEAHIKIGWYYKNHGEYIDAERVFKAAREIDFLGAAAYIGLGWTYCHWWNKPNYLEMAEDMFAQAIRRDPKSIDPYIEAAIFYREPAKDEISVELINKAIKIDPDDIRLYKVLGDAYNMLGKDDLMEEMLSEVRSFPPETKEDYFWLIQHYLERQDFANVDGVFQEVLEKEMVDDKFYRIMRASFELQKKYDLAAKYFRKARGSYLENCYAVTYHSYQRLKDIVDQAGISLVCVQYPMRSVDTLKALVGESDSVVFVDNEQTFKDALAEGAYQEYFSDMFAGDFGHCTREGNRLLAGNVARAIINNLGFAYERQRDTD